MSRYTRIELLVYVSFWLLITSFAVVSSWNLEQVHTLQAAAFRYFCGKCKKKIIFALQSGLHAGYF